MEKTLLVLGAGSDQAFLIKTARSMGLRTVALDKNPASTGFKYSDEYAVVSTRDVPAILRFVDGYRDAGHDIAGVITMGSDIPDVVAAVAAHLKTPGITPESARLATDKLAMKRRFSESGVPVPWFDEVRSVEELKAAVREKGYPLVIKPVDSSGSRGVFKLEEGCELESLFSISRSFSRSGRVMVEKFMEGLQISTETVMHRGRGVTPGFADRNYESLRDFLPRIMENGGWMPSSLSPRERGLVEDLVERASLALGVTDGVTKGDVVMTDEGPKMIEMAARLSGGDFCESLVPLSSGVNYVEAAIRIAIGEDPCLDTLKPRFTQAVVNRYFFPRPGRLVRIDGAEEALKKDWVKKLEFWYRPGETVPDALSHAHRFGVFVAVGATRQEAEQRAAWVYDTIRIITEPEQEELRNCG